VNPQIQQAQIPETAPIRWRSFDGMEIEAMLTKPAGYVRGQRYPLLVIPHGGPHGVITNSFFPFREAWLFASRGWAVFLPNFRGSGNYGERFLRANLGGWGMGDFRDIQTGIDHLVETGLADPDRLAISGDSYGGYIAAWSITQTKRFRAAVVGCGITNIVSFIGTTDVPSRFENYLGTDPRLYVRLSPMEYVDRVRTPALIWHGDQDPRVPPTQGRELYTALKRNGVPAELLIYHGEGHGLSGLRHRKDLLEREIVWLDRWIPAR
jgi:dipeptidyl aminopeptidase/acylaminoacyl peptidase